MNLFSFQKTCLSLSLILVVLILQLTILCRCHLQHQRPGNDAEYHSRHRRSSASAGSRSQQQYGSRKCPPSQSLAASALSEWPRNGSAVFSDQGAGSSKIHNRCGMNTTTQPTQGPGGRNGRRGNNGEQARRGTLDQDSRPKRHRHTDLSLWIDEHQVRLLSGNLTP